ncbi:MAG: sortase [Actinomycetota bacterium]
MLVLATVFAVVGVPQASTVSAEPPLPAHISKFVPIGPVRIADTRPGSGGFGAAHLLPTVYRVKVAGRFGVPTNATEAVVNITAMGTAGPGSAAVYGVGDPVPAESDIVSESAGQTVSNLMHVRIGINGSIDIRRTVGMHFAVDLVGVYIPVSGAVADGRLTTLLAGSKRIVTSVGVAAGSSRVVDLASAVPVGAVAATVVLTVDHARKGYYGMYADGVKRPGIWSLFVDTNGQGRSNQFIVKLNSTNQRIRVFSSAGGRVSIDVVAWYTGPAMSVSTNGLFIPTHHLRRLDKMTGRPLPPLGPVTFEFSVGTSATVSAVVGNILAAGMWDVGTITAKPAGVTAHSVVAARVASWPQTVASQFLVKTSTRGVALTSTVGSFMVVDVAGWFYGPRPTATQATPVNRTLRPTFVNAVRWADSAGSHIRAVAFRADDNLDSIANLGIGASYHNLSSLQRVGNVMVFAHRTEHGGQFRHIDTIRVGSMFSLRGTNGHWYHYRVMYIGVTPPSYRAISAITNYFRPVTAQLVACSKPDGSATSLQWRITITGRLVGAT